MAVSLGRFSWCLWAQGKDKEAVSGGSSSLEFGFGQRDQKKKTKNKKKMDNSTVKGKWQSREEKKIETTDFDFVVVSSSGDDSGSEASEISIGWMEPHGPGFRGCSGGDDEESDGGFAVLVPCYSPGCKELVEGSSSAVFRAITNLPIEFSPDCKDYMDQVLPFRALVPL